MDDQQAASPAPDTPDAPGTLQVLWTGIAYKWPVEDLGNVECSRLDFARKPHLMMALLSLGNGIYRELCAEGASQEAIDCLRGLFIGTGSAIRIEPAVQTGHRRLYRAGYEVYRQGEDGCFFLNPQSRPALVEMEDKTAYLAEFRPGLKLAEGFPPGFAPPPAPAEMPAAQAVQARPSLFARLAAKLFGRPA